MSIRRATVRRPMDGVTLVVTDVPVVLENDARCQDLKNHVDRLLVHAVTTHGIVGPQSLRLLRRVAGLTGQELGVALGVRPETISNWERGHAEKVPPIPWALTASTALDRIGLPEDARVLLQRARVWPPGSEVVIPYRPWVPTRIDLGVSYYLVSPEVRRNAERQHTEPVDQVRLISETPLPRSPTPWHHLEWARTPCCDHGYKRYRLADLQNGYAILSVGESTTP